MQDTLEIPQKVDRLTLDFELRKTSSFPCLLDPSIIKQWGKIIPGSWEVWSNLPGTSSASYLDECTHCSISKIYQAWKMWLSPDLAIKSCGRMRRSRDPGRAESLQILFICSARFNNCAISYNMNQTQASPLGAYGPVVRTNKNANQEKAIYWMLWWHCMGEKDRILTWVLHPLTDQITLYLSPRLPYSVPTFLL